MAEALFSSHLQLNKDLKLSSETLTPARAGPGTGGLLATGRLPGQPRIALTPHAVLDEYLRREHLTPSLDAIAPRLWLVSTPRYWHASPLHAQAVRGRNIVLTENPQLHLVWYYDRVFIKPIPKYLLSSAFWKYLYQDPGKADLRRAFKGFLRTYAFLIRYESDFRLATSQELQLIPACDSSETSDADACITFERFADFIAHFERLSDDVVSPRYTYGELRLTRLNICARIFLGKLTFHHIDSQWGAYLGRFPVLLLPVFAIVSTALAAVQVELGVQSAWPDPTSQSAGVAYALRWVSWTTLIMIAATALFFVALVTFLFVHDIWFASSVLRRKRRHKLDAAVDFKSGVI